MDLGLALIITVLKTGGKIYYDKQQKLYVIESTEGLFLESGVEFPVCNSDFQEALADYIEKFNLNKLTK